MIEGRNSGSMLPWRQDPEKWEKSVEVNPDDPRWKNVIARGVITPDSESLVKSIPVGGEAEVANQEKTDQVAKLYNAGKPIRTIAEEMDIPAGTVGYHVKKAKKQGLIEEMRGGLELGKKNDSKNQPDPVASKPEKAHQEPGKPKRDLQAVAKDVVRKAIEKPVAAEKIEETKPSPVDELKTFYGDIGASLGELVGEKNYAYGDAFGKAGEVLRVLYPNGLRPEQYGDMLTMVRVIDKLFRVATNKDAFGESPWMDIAGYALLEIGKELKGTEKAAS